MTVCFIFDLLVPQNPALLSRIMESKDGEGEEEKGRHAHLKTVSCIQCTSSFICASKYGIINTKKGRETREKKKRKAKCAP